MQIQRIRMVVLVAALATCHTVQCKEQNDATDAIAGIGTFLAGRYENSAQVAQGQTTAGNHAPQHVTVTIEPTPRADWQLWRVHMEVDPAVAQSAGSATELDAVWAMNISHPGGDAPIQLIPYTLRPSMDDAAVKGSAFDESEWLPLEACRLRGNSDKSRIVAQVAADEMCVAVAMGLGGKRAFLPSSIEREGDWLHVQIIYFGEPWRVDARRVNGGYKPS